MGVFDFLNKKEGAPAQDTGGVTLLKKKEAAQKEFTLLKKKADVVVAELGLTGQRARVALAIDISGSMNQMFKAGTVQRVVERILALAMKFDDNGAIDVFLFGVNDYEVGELNEAGFFGYVDREIVAKRKLENGTKYAGVMKRIVDKYTAEKGDPAYVMFVTDGDNGDPSQTEKLIKEASRHAVFWQFIGVGVAAFEFLQQLDTMEGRLIDNANFFKVNDLDKISDDELYRRMLGEFPSWLKLAKQNNLW
ncbi:MAG: VWA domain-containing protein [Deltaproteobacteria bacterium]|nr:VWA domain-containing protein [Deltaproteobacteria bacterium]